MSDKWKALRAASANRERHTLNLLCTSALPRLQAVPSTYRQQTPSTVYLDPCFYEYEDFIEGLEDFLTANCNKQ
jgi:hypothetical protein